MGTSILFEFTAPWIATTPHDGGQPRVLCVEGQFACWSFGCIDAAQVCDGRRDCLDGSDEERCGMYHSLVEEFYKKTLSVEKSFY